MAYFALDVSTGTLGFGRRLTARDDERAAQAGARVAVYRARNKSRKQTVLVCEIVRAGNPSAPAIVRPVAYFSADSGGTLLGNGPNLDPAAYVAELGRFANGSVRS